MADHDALIAQFSEVTAAAPAEARRHLEANAWDLSVATTEYFTALDEGDDSDDNAQQAPEETYTGPRTLDGRPAPQSVSATAPTSRSNAPKQKGVATLGSIGSGSGGHGHAHGDDDDSSSEDERDKPRDLFAGGEKSGLAVQDPSKKEKGSKGLIDDILKKARENAGKHAHGEEASSSASSSRFTGAGQTLGGEDTPSQSIPDPNARAPEPEHVTRTLHIWEEGFSIEDGELRRFDDPSHARDLQMIQNGRAPLHLMGVRPDQPVDVQLVQHNEKFRPPPKVYKPFGGSGHRLGSEVPGESSITAQPVAQAAPAQKSTTSSRPETDVDPSQPTVTLRIQLADGTRMPARFNTTNTIGDVYAFVERASPGVTRPWILATTFPNKDHTDQSLKLEEVPEFKRGGNAVQKWI